MTTNHTTLLVATADGDDLPTIVDPALGSFLIAVFFVGYIAAVVYGMLIVKKDKHLRLQLLSGN